MIKDINSKYEIAYLTIKDILELENEESKLQNVWNSKF